MTVRVRNRLQDGMVNWQETRFQKTEFRQQHADIRRARMSCAESLPNYGKVQDWTGGLGISPSGRLQVIEDVRPKARLVSREGIRWNLAVTVLVILSIVLAAVLLADLAGMGTGARAIEKVTERITGLEETNGRLKEELATSGGQTVVSSEAVKRDMISSGGATTIRLTAPENARLTLSTASKAAENEDLEGRLTSNAGD